jgi:Cu/Ag efflux protein CusF
MKRLYVTVATLAIAAALAACGQKKTAEAPAEPAASANAMASDATTSNMATGAMDMSGGAMTGTGEGEVTAVDKAAGAITLKHGPIPGVRWPAMTMTFKANPASLADQVKVGDKVSFDVKIQGQDNEVTAIRKP